MNGGRRAHTLNPVNQAIEDAMLRIQGMDRPQAAPRHIVFPQTPPDQRTVVALPVPAPRRAPGSPINRPAPLNFRAPQSPVNRQNHQRSPRTPDRRLPPGRTPPRRRISNSPTVMQRRPGAPVSPVVQPRQREIPQPRQHQNPQQQNRPHSPRAPPQNPVQNHVQHPAQPPPPLSEEVVEAVATTVLEVVPYVDPDWLRTQIRRTGLAIPDVIVRQILDLANVPLRAVEDDRVLDVSDELQSGMPLDVDSPVQRTRPANVVEAEALVDVLRDRSTAPDFFCRFHIASMRDRAFLPIYFNTIRVDVFTAVLGALTHDMDILLAFSILHKYRGGYGLLVDFFEEKAPAESGPSLNRILNKGALANVRVNKNRVRPMDICPQNYVAHLAEVHAICGRASGEKKFECGVCFEEQAERKAVVCEKIEEGDEKKEYRTAHQFCRGCVSGYAEASLTETNVTTGGTGLKCMDPSCGRVVIYSAVVRTLDARVRKLFDRRIQEEVLRAAGIQSENCKYCSFAMEMDAPAEVDKVFNCGKCKASFCRLCQRDWAVHIGRPCDELVEKAETEEEKQRKKLEEELALVTVHYCTACNVPFDKVHGCNKMTCRCGRFQCYSCRKAIQGYDHFCNHLHNRNGCPENCGKCLLYGKSDVKGARKKIIASFKGKLPDEYLKKMI